DKEGRLYLVMELVEGITLRERIRRAQRGTQPLPPKESVQIAIEIAKALDAAHGAGIVHRDLKPENVILSSPKSLKVLDFGIARFASGERIRTTKEAEPDLLTDFNQVLGTPRYISPEAISGLPVGPAADLYALGVILFEMLTGKPVFSQKETVLLLASHLKEKPPSLRSVCPELAIPPALEELVAQLLRKTPTERPPSAKAVIEQLERLDWSSVEPIRTPSLSSSSPLEEELISLSDLAASDDETNSASRSITPAPSKEPPHSQPPAPFSVPRLAIQTQKEGTTSTKSSPYLLAISFVLIAVGAGAIFLSKSNQMPAPSTSGAPPPLGSHPPTPKVLISVNSNVQKPVLRWDGQEVEGPSFFVAMDRKPHLLEVSAPGFKRSTVEVRADRPRTLFVPLDPLETPRKRNERRSSSTPISP
ncbi:MAG: serine/threonine protein kinase, partial [Deltaproteobacteria bacterium]|nr:serine/threonine protein kinase [Deltaproteobacteria bacterium]